MTQKGKKVNEIVYNLKSGRSEVETILDQQVENRKKELDKLTLNRLIQEEKEALKGGTGTAQTSGSLIGYIMQLANVDPVKAQNFLDGLDDEQMNKLARLFAMENDRAGAILELTKKSGSNVDEIIKIVNLMRPNNGGVDLKGLAQIFNSGVNAAKASGQPANQMTLDKILDKLIVPFQKTMADEKDRNYQLQIKSLEDKIVNPMDYIKSIKANAAELGFGAQQGGVTERDIQLEQMRQERELDLEKLRWEQQKFALEKDADKEKWSSLQQTFMPIFGMAAPAIQKEMSNLGREVGKVFKKGNGEPQTPTQTQPLEQQDSGVANFECPKCKNNLTISIPPGAPEEVNIKCTSCGEVTPAHLGKEPESQPSTPSASGRKPPTSPPEEPPRSSGLGAKYS